MKIWRGLRNVKAATDLATLAGGQLASKILGFFAFAVLARMLTPGNYGAVETVVGMVAIGHMIIEFGSGTLGIRRVAAGKVAVADTAAAAASSRLIVSLGVVPLLIGAYILVIGGRTPTLLIVLFGLSLFGAVLKLDWLFQATDRMAAAAAGITLKMAIFLGLILVFSPATFGVEAVGWAECLSMAGMAAYFLFAQRRTFRFGLDLSRWSQGLAFLRASAPLGLSGFVNTVAQALPVLFLQSMSAPSEAGEFGAAQRVVVSLVTFSWLYYQNLFPLLTRQISENPEQATKLVKNSDIFIGWAGAIVGVILALGAQPLMRLAFGEALSKSALEFSVLAWCLPVTMASGSARWLLIAQDRQKSQLAVQVIAAIVTIAATAALAPAYGGLGAAFGMLLGAFTVWICAAFFVRNCTVKPAFRHTLAPAAAAIAAVAIAKGLRLDPLVGAASCGGAVILLAIAIPEVRRACLYLMSAKRS